MIKAQTDVSHFVLMPPPLCVEASEVELDRQLHLARAVA